MVGGHRWLRWGLAWGLGWGLAVAAAGRRTGLSARSAGGLVHCFACLALQPAQVAAASASGLRCSGLAWLSGQCVWPLAAALVQWRRGWVQCLAGGPACWRLC